MTGGRPIRFLSLVTAGWIAIRMFAVWQETGSLPQAIRRAVPALPTPSLPMPLSPMPTQAAPATAAVAPPAPATAQPTRRLPAVAALVAPDTPAFVITGPFPTVSPVPAPPTERSMITPILALVTPVAQPQGPPPPGSRRLSISTWLIARDGTASGSRLSGPQLGGTQAGVRIDYALGRNFALTGRLASPAAGTGREASVGIAWRPAGGALRLVAEHRIALDGGRGGPAIGVSGGVSDLPVGAGFRADGYAQAGTIFRASPDHYVDAALRAARPVARIGGTGIDAGAGIWGGAQRDVARIDVGPSVGARIPVGRSTVRLSLDWRQRIAGNARPDSGPALSLGSDF